MSYATVEDVQGRMTRALSEREQAVCSRLLEDAAVLIGSFPSARTASEEAKRTVSCRMVMRALGDGEDSGIPMGASQGSMSGLGYAQSWTFGNGSGSSGELYLARADKQMLGIGNCIGASSPLEQLTRETEAET